MAEQTKKGAISDEKRTASSYIINFYTEVEALNTSYASYANLLVELKYIYNSDFSKLDEGHKQIVTKSVQTVRYYVHKIFVLYVSIAKNVKLKGVSGEQDKKIGTLYNTLNKDFIIRSDDLKDFTILMNGVLITDIMKGLLKTSQDLVNELYSD